MALMEAIARHDFAKICELFEARFGFPHDPKKLASADWPCEPVFDWRSVGRSVPCLGHPDSENNWYCWLYNRATEWNITPPRGGKEESVLNDLGYYVRHNLQDSVLPLRGIDGLARKVAPTTK